MASRIGSGDAMSRERGFTLIELLVVMAIVATLLSLVAPTYFQSIGRAEEAALRSNLRTMREAIDQFYADHGHYPASLAALVQNRYLRELPVDPVLGRADSWLVAPPPGQAEGIFDVRSSAPGKGSDGSPLSSW